MLELGRNPVIDGKIMYENMSDEEYIIHAFEAAKKLSDKIEKIRKLKESLYNDSYSMC